jgi:hypothetical protein
MTQKGQQATSSSKECGGGEGVKRVEVEGEGEGEDGKVIRKAD